MECIKHDKMKIITLMEDTVGASNVKAEHGLSVYVETKHHNLLMDTGGVCADMGKCKEAGCGYIKD